MLQTKGFQAGFPLQAEAWVEEVLASCRVTDPGRSCSKQDGQACLPLQAEACPG